ncbi:MAG: phosphoribosyl-AMP cyclohydrolase, partial [Chloroflexota bacterium]|nr:phosphoribosyl-AMP cyclohydrolase [Chloroflexota bacterium]
GLLAVIHWGADGLVLAVVQHSGDRSVLLVGSMNRDALARTLIEGRLWLWSRSRGELWCKGATSGHFQQVDKIYVNCEQNSLLLQVTPLGPICHAGYATCYYRQVAPDGTLTVVTARQFDPAAVYDLTP